MPLPKSSAARLSPSIILVNSKLRVPLCRHLRQFANPQRGRASFALGSVEGRLLTQRSPVDSFKSVAAITVASTSERTGESSRGAISQLIGAKSQEIGSPVPLSTARSLLLAGRIVGQCPKS